MRACWIWAIAVMLADPPVVAADQPADSTILNPGSNSGAAVAPPAPGLVLPGQPDRAHPSLPPPTLPPRWLLAPPSAAEAAAEAAAVARRDAALAARFRPEPLPPRSFETDIIPLWGGQDWQRVERQVAATLGP